MTGSSPPGDRRELAAGQLRWRCDPTSFPFQTTDEVEPLADIIGQDRATAAIRLGLHVPGSGYNIFVAGFVGTGRNTTIKRFLEASRAAGNAPDDLAYVNNFGDPDRPHLLRLPAGQAVRLRDELDSFCDGLLKAIPLIFESEPYARKRREVTGQFAAREKQVDQAFEARLAKDRFVLVQVSTGSATRPDIVPVIDGKPVAFDEIEQKVASGQFEADALDALRRTHDVLVGEMLEAMKAIRAIIRERDEPLAELDREAARPTVHGPLRETAARFPFNGVGAWLEEVEENILGRLGELGGRRPAGEAAAPPADPADLLGDYAINVIVDNCRASGAPVVIENFPSFRNLFGVIEQEVEAPGLPSRSSFLGIKAGSMLRANGGYLVLNALDVLGEPGVWPMLKRILRTGILEIQSQDTGTVLSPVLLKPEPVDVSVKVVLIGDHQTYRMLYEMDQDFRKIFKVKADFDVEMPNDAEGRLACARFIHRITEEEGLAPFDRTGVAAVVEEGARGAGRSDRLTTRFNDIADLVREASYWAAIGGGRLVLEEHVERALRERRRRVGLMEDRVQEMFRRGELLLATEGGRSGQVNGLTVVTVGDHAFGWPVRITATVGMGRLGIVNIERESDLSGPTHDKGVLILAGLLRERFARDKPLALSASLCFEQSYEGVEGDSASAAEVYALVSALSGLPARQDLGVTGSVNQKGDIQPVGGVNHKIEGFYDCCAARGLTGRQGVLIPRGNLGDLMLRRDIVSEVEAGRFHVYALDRIEDGVELLFGAPAGEPGPDGAHQPGSVFALVDARLRLLAEGLRTFGPADAG